LGVLRAREKGKIVWYFLLQTDAAKMVEVISEVTKASTAVPFIGEHIGIPKNPATVCFSESTARVAIGFRQAATGTLGNRTERFPI